MEFSTQIKGFNKNKLKNNTNNLKTTKIKLKQIKSK